MKLQLALVVAIFLIAGITIQETETAVLIYVCVYNVVYRGVAYEYICVWRIKQNRKKRSEQPVEETAIDSFDEAYRNVTLAKRMLLEVSVTDVDDCKKKLICMASAVPKGLRSDLEMFLAESFDNDVIDVRKPLVEFQLAAKVGRTIGSEECVTLYGRCPRTYESLIAEEMEELPNRNDVSGS